MPRFKPGQSGNPAGKPKGTKHATTAMREAIAADLPEIIQALATKAKEGDTQAASLLLSRCLPPLRPETSTKAIATTGKTLGERAESIVEAATLGELSASTAAELMNALAAQARILETAELERRIAALEGGRNEI